MDRGLTTEVLRVQRLGGLQEGVGQEGLVVGVHLLAVLVHIRAAGQVGTEGGQRYELHQLHIWDVAKTAVIGVGSAHLGRDRRVKGTVQTSLLNVCSALHQDHENMKFFAWFFWILESFQF